MLRNHQKQIVVGMSGGVDSSMALILLKKQGWQPIGVSLKYAVWQDKTNFLKENICCSEESFEIAKKVCKKFNAPHYIFDVADEFKREVIDYFINELKENRTPNPCIVCNPNLKFKKLFEWAADRNIKYVATGHYANIKRNPKTKRYELLKAKDKNKDQTYSLSFLPQEWLGYIVFPLGNYLKSEVYKMAKKEGFEIFLKRKQSQDFCFVAGNSLDKFLEKEIGNKPGLIKDDKGRVLGRHRGLHFYTIGQRKGISLSGGPYYVADKDAKNNFLIVAKNKEELLRQEAVLDSVHFISGVFKKSKKKIPVVAKIRYREPAAKASIFPISQNRMKIVFDELRRAVTPGQFAVFYKGNVCLGGGRIIT